MIYRWVSEHFLALHNLSLKIEFSPLNTKPKNTLYGVRDAAETFENIALLETVKKKKRKNLSKGQAFDPLSD